MRNDTFGALKATAKWCLRQHEGILTPTGRKKKPPSYFIVRCVTCDSLTLTSSRIAKGDRFKCQRQFPSREKTRSSSRPRTRVCLGDVKVIEEIGGQW